MSVGVRTRIRTLLVANRGEIAVRIIRTARAMGIRSVAVFSDADAGSLAVKLADEAVFIGPPPARESYLAMEKITAAAKASGADAVHPGYGFLAENADFAAACVEAGLLFVGPTATTIRAMGDKAQARMRMSAAGVPVLQGYDGEEQSPEVLAKAGETIGFPLLIKPSAGGGGKGMRVVETAGDLRAALQTAQREAVAAFGDGRLILELYLQNARHVEVQVFGDSFGNVVHLFDRDCSVQRRHQKVIEEAPAPDLPQALRRDLHEAAITCARSVDYRGAGTVEFLVADDRFFFMEMNTRLQVEHPVTEAITGLDLVEWQLRVAAGERLPQPQSAITCQGHAIEARLCAEDPDSGFLPSTGRIEHLALPEERAGIRVDTGFQTGDSISVHYDSLLAKIVARGADRGDAMARLAAALKATEIVGPATNRAFLARIVDHPAFAGIDDLDTRFIERHDADLLAAAPPPDALVIAAAAFLALRRMERAAGQAADPADPFSPWDQTRGWRLGGAASRRLELEMAGDTTAIDVTWVPEGYKLAFAGHRLSVAGRAEPEGAARLRIDDQLVNLRFFAQGADIHLFARGIAYHFTVLDPGRSRGGKEVAGGRIVSPMPGLVLAVSAAAGDAVEKGQALVVIEAMKMEHTVAAPRAGKVRSVDVGVGEQVVAGAELVVLEAEA
ncbi:acetyl/propionyl/methylcrotonyl-CoA carboxylase subunit alpha [Labrys okinawensis]|uniref:acetyl/propionyl/methylcrotonyl-CoA carboxylase subunit alpha n=1 Tax=Labrys okinawensis TaxID=346911 RepID=UPI0039BC2C17